MRLTRRHVLRALGAAGIGLAAGPIAYGAAYERHRLVRVDHDVPVSGLPPPVLISMRVSLGVFASS